MAQQLLDAGGYVKLAERLSKCPEVSRYDSPEFPESSTLAHAFWDLEGSFREFLDVHLVKLTNEDLDPTEVTSVLQRIGEEFRHILYHINDPLYYRYLRNDEYEFYSQTVAKVILQRATEVKRELETATGESRHLLTGELMGLGFVVTLMRDQAKVFDIPLTALSLDGIDPDNDFA